MSARRRLGALAAHALLAGSALAGCSAAGGPRSVAAGTGAGAGGGGALTVGSGPSGSGGSASSCKVSEQTGDALPTCVEYAPPDSFAPVVKWTWTAPFSGYGAGSEIIPLVGNFTDDNGDGVIDLCDTPDILVTATVTWNPATAILVLLAGDTGKEELVFPGKVSNKVTPAIGDIDGDGLLEVVAADTEGHLVAYENDGTLKWKSEPLDWLLHDSTSCTAIALYDLDGDGQVEILAAFDVFDASGHRLWGKSYDATWPPDQNTYDCPTPTAADLDGDGKLEVLFGHETYHADGSLYWALPGPPGHAAFANLDFDPEPEIVFTNRDGITIVEADGTVKLGPVRPTNPAPGARSWGKPVTIHDFDGDGRAEVGAASDSDFAVYKIGATATPIWVELVQDSSGLSMGTAFDFVGGGAASAIYEDETKIYVFNGKNGHVEFDHARPSGTLIEYPVVADVDNDGSADVVVVANDYPQGTMSPSVIVLGDAKGRWVPTRRIWNQHAYHVTNVREDGTIPKVPDKSWKKLNTFRANAQVNKLGDCRPVAK